MSGIITNALKADVLIQALPYIQRYFGKVVVIKYGGNAMQSQELREAVMTDVVLLSLIGIKVVLVHGGGPEITDLLNRLGIESRFVGGLRYTDQETVKAVQMVLCGKVNKDLVNLLGQAGGRAVGLCGLDGGMIRVKKLMGKEDLGFVGDITGVDTAVITDQLAKGYIPVISTVGCGEDGEVYNVNADLAASAIAGALGAENLVMMTDVRGLLTDKNDESTLISSVNIGEVPRLIKEGIISGGMIPKIESCTEAVRLGVKKAFIIDGRIPHSILIELMTNEGIGTMFEV
ncbi:MAG: acetylglutamate kinase [Oscillospiraceae bacterium]|jgi:acetylglutamate kinase|nr:acetylglutamate kinase [Oscillospiraceae bacterium]